MATRIFVIIIAAALGAQLSDADSASAAPPSAAPPSAAPPSAAARSAALTSAVQSVHPNLWHGTASAVPGASTDTERFVDHLLAQLTLEEKVAQMIQADIASISPAELRRFKLGSILAGGNAAPANDIRSGPQAWLELTDEFHAAAIADTAASHPPIPIVFGIDAVHGHAKVRGATIYPHNVALGAAHDPDLVRRIGEATAAEVAATGIDWTFAPTVAVARDVRWGRSYESYSESPELVARYAPAMVAGLQGQWGSAQFMAPGRTLATVKHFVGDGGTGAGRDQGDTVTAEALLAGVHAAGYAPAIDAGALIVMASYSSWNGLKMHANHYLLTDILKGRMGFAGFVVGDWNAQEQIPGCTKSRCATAILAGVDMLMAPDSWRELYENTLAEVRSGEIPQVRIDDAVRRILLVKAIAGMFDRPASSRRAAGHFEDLGSAAHRTIAREAVRKSLVLLKNAHGTLPLSPRARVLVAGAAADDIGIQCGGWTLDWQGDHNVNADFPGATSIYGGISAAVARAGGTAELSRDGEFTDRPDAAIVVFGETPYAEFEGVRETLEFSPSDKSALRLLRRFRALHIPTVSVFLSGRPLWVNAEINASDAFVAAWLPGSEGAGIADVIFRGPDGSAPYDFTGRLAFSWPDSAMPVRFGAGQARGALYANGFGLDYHSHDTAGPLSEDARIAARFRAPPGSLFSAGHPTAPWSLFVADGGDQVHVTTARQASPHGAVDVTLAPAGAVVSWHGTQDGMLLINGRAVDFRDQPGGPEPGGPEPGGSESRGREPRRPEQGGPEPGEPAGPRAPAQGGPERHGSPQGGSEMRASEPGGPESREQSIALRYRVDRRPEGSVVLGMQCSEPGCAPGGAGMVDVTRTLQSAKVGAWQELRIPLSCVRATGTDLAHVDVPFAVAASEPFGMTIAEVRVTASEHAPQAPCPPAARRVK